MEVRVTASSNVKRMRQAKLLIVDDNRELCELLEGILRKEGYEQVRAVYSCAGAEMEIQREKPDLMILDVNFPGEDGFSFFQRIQKRTDLPVLFLSARDGNEDRITGLGLGADDYMTKPFSPSELVARVKAHMDRYNRLIGSNVRKNDIVEIRGIKIDKTARRVWVNGEETTFTSKEYDLLTFLAENPNRVFTKEELFREIWDMESVGDIATVTVHIKKIREKIEFNTAKPQYIETIWGVGYRFKV